MCEQITHHIDWRHWAGLTSWPQVILWHVQTITCPLSCLWWSDTKYKGRCHPLPKGSKSLRVQLLLHMDSLCLGRALGAQPPQQRAIFQQEHHNPCWKAGLMCQAPVTNPCRPNPPLLNTVLLFHNNSKEIKLPSPFEQRLLSSPAWLSFLREVHCPSLARRTSGLPGGSPYCPLSQLLLHHLSAAPPVSLVSLTPRIALCHRSALQALPPSCLCLRLDFLRQPWARRAPLPPTQSGGARIWSLLIWLS